MHKISNIPLAFFSIFYDNSVAMLKGILSSCIGTVPDSTDKILKSISRVVCIWKFMWKHFSKGHHETCKKSTPLNSLLNLA